jgi:hypothetical protein
VLADDSGRPCPIRAERGITIPWLRPGSWHNPRDDHDEDGPQDPGPRWVGVNVRRFDASLAGPAPKPKYLAFTGSTRGNPYPLADLTAGVPLLVVEGELDALVGCEHLGHIVNVTTVGGASQMPSPDAVAALDVCPRWLLAFDHDDAGRSAALKWRAAYPDRAVRVWLPGSKDLTDFIASDADPVRWMVEILDRYGLPVPACCR